MPNSDKAAEPSMEEILASIRKIISEEPEAADVATADRDPVETPAKPPSAEVSTSGAVWTSGPGGADDDLSDILDHPASDDTVGAGQPTTPSGHEPVLPPPTPSRPTFGQRQAPPPVENAPAGPAANPPPAAPPTQSKPGDVADSPFGLPLPVQPLNAEGPTSATPPLPAAPPQDRGAAPSLRRASAPPGTPPPFGASAAEAPIVPPPNAPPAASRPSPDVPLDVPRPTLAAPMPAPEAAKPAPGAPRPMSQAPRLDETDRDDDAENSSLGFTLADRLRAFGADGGSEQPQADEAVKPETDGAPPAKADEEAKDAVPFALRARRNAPPAVAPEPEKPEPPVKFGAMRDDAPPPPASKADAGDDQHEPAVATPEPPARHSLFGGSPRADSPPTQAQATASAEIAARETAIRRGIFGMPEPEDEAQADENKPAASVDDPDTISDVIQPSGLIDDDAPIGARALEILAGPSQPAEPFSSKSPLDAPATATQTADEPVVDTGSTLPPVQTPSAIEDALAPPAVAPTAAAEPTTATTAPPADVGDAPAPAATTEAAGGQSRTLEDTVSELLRPMLKNWLNANMPRIVEKALKEELTDQDDEPPKAAGPKASDD